MRLQRYRGLIIYLLDIMIMAFVGCGLFFCFPEENGTNSGNILLLLPDLLLLMLCVSLTQLVMRTYNSLWRYAESQEYLNLMLSVIVGFLAYFLISSFVAKNQITMLFSVATTCLSFMLMLMMRFLYRRLRRARDRMQARGKHYLAIVGAGSAGVRLLDEVMSDVEKRYIPYCFFDDSPEKIGKYIHGLEIKGPIEDLPTLLKNTPVYDIIVAIPSLSAVKRRAILNTCSGMKCRVKILPDTIELLQTGEGNLVRCVREVRVEDLMGRDPVCLDAKQVKAFLSGKVVMVTGGGGSIGSELCRQMAKCAPKQLIILDVYENGAYDIQQELREQYGTQLQLEVEIASVRDEQAINQIFEFYRPEVVFHAAAHKHVPLMEHCPAEAIKNNVFGTWNIARAADRVGTKKFVLISSDKAVNPTNVMGATKRLCEMILQGMRTSSRTEFAAVRFGNVLGSSGSVVPLFKRQIEHGGPVTVTDRRVVRYFMTIPEAVQLVLQAGAMAKDSEVFVLDMGDPMKIIELAENLVRLSGYVPYEDIPIVETGLRPGEKLYEELLIKNENLVKTENKKIFIEQQEAFSRAQVEYCLNRLDQALMSDVENLCQVMRELVPTYRTPDEVNTAAIAYNVDSDAYPLLQSL